jgi:EAL and modified HD-GYP domain-containing signal transduction protein
MMELLGAKTLTPDECDSAFVVGIFSLLDEMLCVPMEKALELLALQPAVQDALLHGTGTLGRMLVLTKAAEEGDDQAFASAATDLGYTNHHVNSAHLEALVWADSFVIQ